ncbi:MAG TPA: 4'-phosphopantetheinyl transferase superfamily protein [Solirubrobacteraceae bacterium]|nr:4'-phosphopantetheinyl transferase superfamily protein [Solirubrobacteraceae bacterium]
MTTFPSLGGTLRPDQVHVWVVPLEDPAKPRRRELAHLAEGILLASYLALTPARLEFERGPGGKPRLRGEPLQYNLSHSERFALVAVSAELPVGVDVQAPHPATERPWFARRICSPREYAQLEREPLGPGSHGPAAGPAGLLRLWTRKEAVLKARGEGSYVAVNEIDVLDDRVAGGWRCVDLALGADAPGYTGVDAPGYCAAVALPDRAGTSVCLRRFVWP